MTGSLRLGAIATLGPYLFPHVLGPIRKKFPRLELNLREGLTDGLLAELKSGNLDAVLAAQTFNEDGFSVFPIGEEPFVLFLPAGHALAQAPSVSARDLKAEEMVLLEDGHCLRDQLIDICPTNRRGNVRRFHATSLETIRYLVGSGAGYTFLPQLAVREERKLKGLTRYRRLEGRPVSRRLVLVCRERFARKAELEILAGFLRDQLTRILGET